MSSSTSPRRSLATWLVPTVVVLVAAVAIALILLAQRPDSSTEATGASEEGDAPVASAEPSPAVGDAPTEVGGEDGPDLSSAERRDPGDPLAIGPADAPVGLIVFSDYQCPYCAKWSVDTLPEMKERADSGDLRIEFRDVNVFGEASVRGARAAYAAALQGELLAMHAALFADGMPRAASQLTDDALVAQAQEIGLDVAQFEEDYRSDATADAVAENQQLGLDLGAYSTPAFLLDGQPLVGAQPTEVFVDQLDAALAAADSEG